MRNPATLVALILALLLARGAAAGDAVTAAMDPDGVQRATIKLDSYSYTPDHLVVQAGIPVELTLVNESSLISHDLVIDDPASGLDVRQNVGGGDTGTLRFTPERSGSFAFYCSKKAPFMASHRAKGMEGVLEVHAAPPAPAPAGTAAPATPVEAPGRSD